MARVLVIGDEECVRSTFEDCLSGNGHQVVCTRDHDEALACISQMGCDVVFASLEPGDKSGLHFLRAWRERGVTCPVVVITDGHDEARVAEARLMGAFGCVSTPVEREALLRVTESALLQEKDAEHEGHHRLCLDAILRSVEDMIVTVDDRMVITQANEAGKALCGHPAETIGKDIRTLDLECARKCFEPLVETIAKGQPLTTRRLECGRSGNPAQAIRVSTYPLLERPGVVTGAVMVVRDESRLARLERDLGERRRLHNLLGRSSRMHKVFALLEALAGVESTVLITGESGTGKELAAEALHFLGSRRDQPFVKVNCSALSESLLESELFGHVRGAFTGAVRTRIGRFQRADRGTIFIDEIGDLPPNVQSRLLRVLQKKEFERVGDSTPVKTTARIISATNKDLRRLVALREFREDLFYRLDVVEVHMPPLRERREDIPLLVDHFLAEFSRRLHKAVFAISSEVESLFMRHSWPGNVRELEHALERACILCNQNVVTMDFLPEHLKREASTKVFPIAGKRAIDRRTIAQALEQTAGNKQRAARLLGIDRKTLYRNLAKYRKAGIA